MRRSIAALFLSYVVLIGPATGLAQAAQENHGAVISWTASPNAATCLATSTPACTNAGYWITEGPGPGLESTTTTLNATLLTTLTYTDDGSTMNAYLNTTRCYLIGYAQTVGGVTTITNGKEACASWPGAPAGPGTVVIVTH